MSTCAIIVSFRTGAVLADCLAALASASGLDEIVIVDNGNAPAETLTLDRFAAADARVKLQRGQGNVGFAAACNLAARQAVSDVLVFVNPDVILRADAISALAVALAAAPPPAIVGGDLRDGQGRPDRGSRRDRLTLWRAFVSFSGLSRLERVTPALRDFNRHRDPLPDRAVGVGAVSGALMAMRRVDLNALGGFDEEYFVHVEDLDLCRRAEAAGWRVLFQPGPHGLHVRSSSDVGGGELRRHKARSMARYFRKFAQGPVEKVCAGVAGSFLILVVGR
ncbi:glycosyltransferase [Terricaulis sp.]|uniref:glycosyltransferase n=1 Tax=Terricaulis sp. TaxID=2768686 RepID=UPI0037836256